MMEVEEGMVTFIFPFWGMVLIGVMSSSSWDTSLTWLGVLVTFTVPKVAPIFEVLISELNG